MKSFRFAHGEHARAPWKRSVKPRKSRAKFARGSRLVTWRQFIRWLDIEPSVWWSTANRPIPCTVVKNWQLRQVQAQLMHGCFSRVVRK